MAAFAASALTANVPAALDAKEWRGKAGRDLLKRPK
jgi:hypothetical protein